MGAGRTSRETRAGAGRTSRETRAGACKIGPAVGMLGWAVQLGTHRHGTECRTVQSTTRGQPTMAAALRRRRWGAPHWRRASAGAGCGSLPPAAAGCGVPGEPGAPPLDSCCTLESPSTLRRGLPFGGAPHTAARFSSTTAAGPDASRSTSNAMLLCRYKSALHAGASGRWLFGGTGGASRQQRVSGGGGGGSGGGRITCAQQARGSLGGLVSTSINGSSAPEWRELRPRGSRGWRRREVGGEARTGGLTRCSPRSGGGAGRKECTSRPGRAL